MLGLVEHFSKELNACIQLSKAGLDVYSTSLNTQHLIYYLLSRELERRSKCNDSCP